MTDTPLHSRTPEFRGLNIVVSGGTGALGRHILKSLLAEGASLFVPVFGEPPDDFQAEEEGLTLFPNIDLSAEAQVCSFYSELPPLSASIHIAGGFSMGSIEEVSVEEFEFQWRLNVLSVFLCCREAVRNMRASKTRGRLVQVGARPALEPSANLSAYSSAKAGVLALSRSLAAELGPEGIFSNAIIPGIIDTPANRAAMPDADVSEWTQPSDIARVVCQLASPDNRSVNGAQIPVYGGNL